VNPCPGCLRLPTTFVINGRFGVQRVSGVQRVARGLLKAIDGSSGSDFGQWNLLSPAGASWPLLQRVKVVVARFPLGAGHLWEQTAVAAAAARGGRILNIAGSGPWFGGPQVSWLHDAAVFDHPQAYRPAFVRWYRALFLHRARRGDCLITPSEHARQRLAHHLAVPPSRLHVLPHGADHLDAVVADRGLLTRLGLRPGGYWLCVASRNPNKNLSRLLRAHGRAGSGLPLVLAGGSDRRVFSEEVGAVATHRLRVLQDPSDAALKALILGARALLVPSIAEGFGLPALEAQRLGCPVLAARAGALPEVCGDAALYVDPFSEDEMAAGLDRMASDEALVANLRIAGALHAAPYTWARAATSLQALLRQEATP
jgi:glycosyltransferase involved in cell wall biosynthesis